MKIVECPIFPSLQAAKTVKYGSSVDGISTAEPEQYAKRWDTFFTQKRGNLAVRKKVGRIFLRNCTQKGVTHFFTQKGGTHFFTEQYAKGWNALYYGAVRKKVGYNFFWSTTHKGGRQFLRCLTQFFMAQYAKLDAFFYGAVCKKV